MWLLGRDLHPSLRGYEPRVLLLDDPAMVPKSGVGPLTCTSSAYRSYQLSYFGIGQKSTRDQFGTQVLPLMWQGRMDDICLFQ